MRSGNEQAFGNFNVGSPAGKGGKTEERRERREEEEESDRCGERSSPGLADKGEGGDLLSLIHPCDEAK